MAVYILSCFLFMRNCLLYIIGIVVALSSVYSFTNRRPARDYQLLFERKLDSLEFSTRAFIQAIHSFDFSKESERQLAKKILLQNRLKLKAIDFFLRYLDPVQYKKINGPLPIEWETEVFEKFEKPYRRIGAGYTLALQYLEDELVSQDSMVSLLAPAVTAINSYRADSNMVNFRSFDPFFLCNRLFLLNLAAIYTTGFECPDKTSVIPEMVYAMKEISVFYRVFNQSFPDHPLTDEYLNLYDRAIIFCEAQPSVIDSFDHFLFIRDYVNPLFRQNQEMIASYNVKSRSYNDYSINKESRSLFSKTLFRAQSTKGVFLRIYDSSTLAELDRLGKLLFYDPILSGNNKRSCVSCHKPREYFTDTSKANAIGFDGKNLLTRNTPSLLNAVSNHLVMADGKHLSLLDQTRAVVQSPTEMGSTLEELMKKILSCGEYRRSFERLLKFTPAYDQVEVDHIASAITYYYGKFSGLCSPFDRAINKEEEISPEQKSGFNIFMGKAQCGTCHFVPVFNGVKPPYIGSEFEVLGVPQDSGYRRISDDQGRYLVNPAEETLHAFRTGTIRNSASTGPYMHNGVFKSLEQVIDFYDKGGGKGRGLLVNNQTLESDSLHLTPAEKRALISFIYSLNENYQADPPPVKLPASSFAWLNKRKIGGEY